MIAPADAVNDYLRHCRARGLSPRTLKDAYGFPLKGILVPFCVQRGIEDVGELSRELLDDLAVELEGPRSNGRVLSTASRQSYLRGINVFLHWVQTNHAPALAARSQLPRRERRALEVLSRAEIQRMEDAGISERDQLLLRVMADTGARLSEVARLRTADLREVGPREQYLRVRGKGAKERLLPISGKLHARLRRYIVSTEGRRKEAGGDEIFMGTRRRPGGSYEPLTPRGVYQVIKYLAERAGIEKRVYPHLLRHSYATSVLRKGMNPLILRDILGHESLEMIQRTYAHLTVADAHRAAMEFLADDED